MIIFAIGDRFQHFASEVMTVERYRISIAFIIISIIIIIIIIILLHCYK